MSQIKCGMQIIKTTQTLYKVLSPTPLIYLSFSDAIVVRIPIAAI